MIIRSETTRDYAAIAAVNVHAFDNRATEALIVTLHRHRPAFDPELSLVAEHDGRIVGHVLFSPRSIRLLDHDVAAVNLAPIAVDPKVQKTGIGARLIQEGHARAREKGYELSFLLGHTSYYPRFGYLMHAFGGSSVTVATADLPHEDLSGCSPTQADILVLRDLWHHEEDAVDFAIDPGDEMMDWLSPHPEIEATVWSAGQAIVGYTRIARTAPATPRSFLARDLDAARAIAGTLARGAGAREVTLPLHPASASASAFSIPTTRSWDAAMVCPLSPGVFQDYYAHVKAGERPPGRPIWPVPFELE